MFSTCSLKSTYDNISLNSPQTPLIEYCRNPIFLIFHLKRVPRWRQKYFVFDKYFFTQMLEMPLFQTADLLL